MFTRRHPSPLDNTDTLICATDTCAPTWCTLALGLSSLTAPKLPWSSRTARYSCLMPHRPTYLPASVPRRGGVLAVRTGDPLRPLAAAARSASVPPWSAHSRAGPCTRCCTAATPSPASGRWAPSPIRCPLPGRELWRLRPRTSVPLAPYSPRRHRCRKMTATWAAHRQLRRWPPPLGVAARRAGATRQGTVEVLRMGTQPRRRWGVGARCGSSWRRTAWLG